MMTDPIKMGDRMVVVAGNGVSIATLPQGVIREDDFIIRTNNFFFEERHYLGRRVDLAFMGGDPRVAPFMFETLHRCRSDYDLRGWSSHNPKVIRAGQRRFAPLFQTMQYRDDTLAQAVQGLIERYRRHPTTGVYAALLAHALGARDILLAGMDFYSTPRRYPFEPGPHYRALMGQDLGTRGMDQHLHDLELDHAILRLLQSRGDLQLWRVTDNPLLNDVAQLAGARGGGTLDEPRSQPPTDWANRVGLYPISLLKALRKGSTMVRDIKTKMRRSR